MEKIYDLILERNSLETAPFREVYESNCHLNSLIRTLEIKCHRLESEYRQHSQKDQLELVQRQIIEKEKQETEFRQQNTKLTVELSKLEEEKAEQNELILQLRKDIEEQESAFIRIKDELSETVNVKNITEKQYDSLKDTINRLREENESLQSSNEELVNRIMTEKEKSMEEMIKMTELLEQANKKVDMLTAMHDQQKKQFEKRRFHFGKTNKNSPDEKEEGSHDDASSMQRQFGSIGVVPPTKILQKIHAHISQINCVRYSPSENQLIATCSDSNICVMSTSITGTTAPSGPVPQQPLKTKTFRGPTNQVMLSLDISSKSELIAGASSDKTCRIWNLRNERLVHQLVGHHQKVTAVKFLYDGGSHQKSMIVTSSADRSIKVWDISRSTYRQNITMRHGATAQCLDTSFSNDIVSGHADGGVRFWDYRSNECIGDISDLHDATCGGITSVMFHPSNPSQILTMGRDSILKLVDVRMTSNLSSESSRGAVELQKFQHVDMKVDLSCAGCTISPDGKYVAAGSSNGNVFIWRTLDGTLENQFEGHGGVGVVSVAWGRSSGQQFASVDKMGYLYLWA